MKHLFAFLALLFTILVQAQTLADLAQQGDKYLSEKSYESAITSYKLALALDTTNADYVTAGNLATCYQELGRSQEAIDALLMSIEKGNTQGSVINRIVKLGQDSKCNSCLEKTLMRIQELIPQQTTFVQKRLFYLYGEEKKFDLAMVAAKNVLIEEPQNKSILENVVMIYAQKDQLDSAMVYSKRLCDIDPSNASANRTLATIYASIAQDKTKQEDARYKRILKPITSQYNEMMRNRLSIIRQYYPLAIKHAKTANASLNDASLAKQIKSWEDILRSVSN